MRSISTGLVLAALVVGFGLLGFGCVGTPKNPTTAKEVEDKIRVGVPIGATRSEVEAWFKSQGIESYYEGKPKPMIPGADRPSYDTVIEQSGLDPETIGGTVSGGIADTERDFMVTWSLQILFFLDKDGKLMKYQVKNQGTGL
jgi:hypothetical protein